MSVLNLCQANVSNTLVCLLGLGTVFCGLICIIALCKVIGWVCSLKKPSETTVQTAAPVSTSSAEIPNRRETVAAISAAIAEETGSDISAIRILKIERL